MQSLAKKYKTQFVIGFVAIALIALSVGIAFALGAIGNSQSTGHIATGANLSILSASISNSTNRLPCSFTSTIWSCSIEHVAQGTNLTTYLVVQNTGSGVGFAYSNSTMIQGASLGSLINEYTILNPISINAGANSTLKIIFVVLPSAAVGQTVQYNSTIF